FANFAAEVMVFFGAYRVGASWESFHLFQVATVLALWGVVISAIYMLRAYGAIFMGRPNERSVIQNDLASSLRYPVILLVATTLVVGFFPNTLLRLLRPTFPAAVASAEP